MTIQINPIGVIHTPFQDVEKTPIQSSRSNAPGVVEVFPEFLEGLDGIEEFSHLILVYFFHHAPDKVQLRVKPFLDDRLHGVFATRYPYRPNLLGITVVRLLRCDGNQLYFESADMLDGTPLLDIKPYVPDFDVFNVEKTGWYKNRKYS
jgi:tRNA (adenine37-N6)-methyltransferase